MNIDGGSGREEESANYEVARLQNSMNTKNPEEKNSFRLDQGWTMISSLGLLCTQPSYGTSPAVNSCILWVAVKTGLPSKTAFRTRFWVLCGYVKSPAGDPAVPPIKLRWIPPKYYPLKDKQSRSPSHRNPETLSLPPISAAVPDFPTL